MAGNHEIRLLTRAAAGDAEAFRSLFEAHQEAVFRLAWHLAGTVEAAEDITQDCFLRLVRHADRFQHERGSLRQYLYGMVRNLARQRWDATGRETPLDDEGGTALPATDAGAPERIAVAEITGAVHAAIATLPLLQREALVLFEFEELSLQQVAEIMGCDPGAVKSRLHRARARLRRLLAPYREERPTRSMP